MKIISTLCAMLLSLLSTIAFAAAPAWKIEPAASNIKFTATQNGSPVSGEFKSFTGDINFDPSDLATSHVSIDVDLGSVSTSYGEVADTLKTPDWFNVKVFPKAVFKADHFTKTGDKTYTADGTLTIRDKSQSVTLTFTLQDYSKTKALANGSTTIKRTAFGVGQGDWAKTDAVKDEVKIDFTVSAIAK